MIFWASLVVKRLLGKQRWEAWCIRGSATRVFSRMSTLDGKKEGLPLALEMKPRPHFVAQWTNVTEYYRGIPVQFSVPYSPLPTCCQHTLTEVTVFVTNTMWNTKCNSYRNIKFCEIHPCLKALPAPFQPIKCIFKGHVASSYAVDVSLLSPL